ncbi:MAG: hypothetical protein Fur0041_12940 [Bacteroidia bacterium]
MDPVNYQLDTVGDLYSMFIPYSALSYDSLSFFYVGYNNQISTGTTMIYKVDLNNNLIAGQMSIPSSSTMFIRLSSTENNVLYAGGLMFRNNHYLHRVFRMYDNFTMIDSIDVVDSCTYQDHSLFIHAISSQSFLYGYNNMSNWHNKYYKFDLDPVSVPPGSEHSCAQPGGVLSAAFWSQSCRPQMLSVFDISGRLLYEERQPEQWSFTPAAAGIYIVHVRMQNGTVVRQKVFLMP